MYTFLEYIQLYSISYDWVGPWDKADQKLSISSPKLSKTSEKIDNPPKVLKVPRNNRTPMVLSIIKRIPHRLKLRERVPTSPQGEGLRAAHGGDSRHHPAS